MQWGQHISRICLTVGTCVVLDGCTQTIPRPDAVAGKPLSSFADPSLADLPSAHSHTETDAIRKVSPAEEHSDLWARIRKQFTLLPQLAPRHRLHANAGQFWSGLQQQHIDQIAKRAHPYLFHIMEQLEQRGMPGEIALLPIVESQYQPHALSPVNAAGIWQMIPATGKRFGLRQNAYYDGRKDILASTDAALSYLQFLHKRFHGDWLLALAAYNCGEGLVDAAVDANRAIQRSTDFWSLHLPAETRRYIPRLLAIANIIAEPERHNLALPPIENQPYLTEVLIKGQIRLDKFANLADLGVTELKTLNPGFIGLATEPKSETRLVIPAANAWKLQERLGRLPPALRRIATVDPAVPGAPYVEKSEINRGDRFLAALSPRDGHRHTALAAYPDRGIDARTEQLTQRDSESVQPWPATGNEDPAVREVSARHGLLRPTAEWTSRYNRDGRLLQSAYERSDGAEGRFLHTRVAGHERSAGTPGTAARYVRYRVQDGDSLWRISQRFRVTVEQIRRWNDIMRKDVNLAPGHVLHIYANVGAV